VEFDALVELAAKRLMLAVDVAAAKFVTGQQVDDLAREQEILDWAARGLGQAEPGAGARVAFFRDQIVANKIIQRGLLARWRCHPEDFPGQSRSLTADVRPVLDTINRHMVLLLSHAREATPEQGALARVALDGKLAAAPALRELGEPRREASRVALRSLPSA
jgi:chorismate mutase